MFPLAIGKNTRFQYTQVTHGSQQIKRRIIFELPRVIPICSIVGLITSGNTGVLNQI